MIPLAVRRAAVRELGAADERFWSNVDLAGPVLVRRLGRCWTWTGGTQEAGRRRYGRFRPGGSGRHVYAHRWARGTVEELVAGLEVDHLCRNPICVRPSHLEQVTGAENRRRENRDRPRITACRRAGHPYTGDNRIVRADGSVACRACQRERQRAWSAGRSRNGTEEGLRPDREGAAREGAAHEAQGPRRGARPPAPGRGAAPRARGAGRRAPAGAVRR